MSTFIFKYFTRETVTVSFRGCTWTSLEHPPLKEAEFFWQLLSSSLPLGELATWWHQHLFLAHSGKPELEERKDLFCTSGINLQNTGQICSVFYLLAAFEEVHKDNCSFVWHHSADPGWGCFFFFGYLKLVGAVNVAEEACVHPRGGGSQSPETWPFFKWKCICAFISVHWQPVLKHSPPTG